MKADSPGHIVVRPIADSERRETGLMWQASMHKAYTWMRPDQLHPLDEALRFFDESICARCDVFVAVRSGQVVGLLALEGAVLDHLFVHEDFWERGIGSLLLDHAKALQPQGLELVTLQRNTRARRFYERRGFVETKTGVSPPPENEPDVWYAWKPGG